MASIENLNFEVILKDDNFRKRIEEDKRLAQELNTSLTNALNFNKKISIEPLRRVRKEIEDIGKSGARHVGSLNTQLATSSNLMRTLGQLTGATFSVIGLRRFLSTLIDVTGQFEVQKMALRNMLQDIDGADKIFQDLYNFSSNSTYRFSELAKYAKQLAAFNIDKSNLLETTKMLGDVASGVGVSMDRLILAYGHVKSSGFLRGIQLRSFSQNGVPILEELSKMFTEIEGKAVSLGDVFDKMTKREIGFDMVEEAFRRMTSEGGKFYQMQEVLAKTLSGQINILKGKWENLMYAIGESQEGVLKGAVAALTRIVSSTESFGTAVKDAIAVLGAYRIATIIATLSTEGLAAAINTSLVGRAFKGVLAFAQKNPYAIIAAAIASLVIWVVKVNKELSDTQKITKALADTTDEYNAAQNNEIRELDLLIGRMRSARDGTDEYKAAKLALEKRFDPYIQKLRDEGVAVNDLSALYDGLAKKITEANKQRFLEQAQSSIAQAYGDALNNIEADTKRIIGKIANELGRTLTGNEEGAIRHYVSTGEKNETFKSLGDVLQKHEIIAVAAEGVYGAVQRSEQSFADDLRDLMNRNTDAADKYSDAMVDAAKRFDAAEDRIAGGADASQQTYKISSIIAGIKKLDAEIEKLRQKAKTAGITEEEKGLLEGLVEDRETQAKLYKSLMGVDYDKQIKAAQTADDKATRDRISGIKAEISVLEKYSAAREKLEPWFGSDTDKELTKIFGDGKDYSTLDAQILSLCDSLRELGDAGVEAADQIEARLGLDKTSLIAKKQQQLKKYEASLQPYLGKDFSFSGSGIEYKASRILADYNTKVEQATQEYEKLYIEARRLDEETRTLGEQFSAELAQLEAERDEKFVALAESIYGEQTKGLNLSEWAHKSGGEIRGIIAALKGISVPQELAKILDENALKALADALNALANADIEKATNAFDNNKLRNWQKWAGAVSEIGSALKEYGDAAGNDTIAGIGEALSFVSETASDVFSRLAQGDILGASLSFIENIAKEIFAAATAAEEFKKALREANEEARYDAMIGMLGEDSIFGENGMRKVRDAVSVMQEARASMNGRDISRALKFKGGIGVLGLLKQAPQTLARLAESIGRDLYDAYGNLNADTLQAILDTYDDLKQTEKEWITQAIDDSKAYSEAMEQLDGVMQDIFGQITSSAADAIVDKWADAGDAALDYVDILDDVARAYAKMITQSMLLDSVFDDNFKQDLLKRFSAGDTEGAMELILQGMERMQELAPAIAEALEPLRPYIKTSSSSTDTLKDGINKELVEGNSSLIASYINAMRADLSVMRGMQTTGWSDVRFIREHLPTLADHLSDIAGNTFDNATAAQGILAKLTGIITTSTNGGNAVRTTK